MRKTGAMRQFEKFNAQSTQKSAIKIAIQLF
jgi:hypothetical protein